MNLPPIKVPPVLAIGAWLGSALMVFRYTIRAYVDAGGGLGVTAPGGNAFNKDANPDSPRVNANPLSFLDPPSASGTRRPDGTWTDSPPKGGQYHDLTGQARTKFLHAAWTAWKRQTNHPHTTYAQWVAMGQPGINTWPWSIKIPGYN